MATIFIDKPHFGSLGSVDPSGSSNGSQLDRKITVDIQWMDIHLVKRLCDNEFHQDKIE